VSGNFHAQIRGKLTREVDGISAEKIPNLKACSLRFSRLHSPTAEMSSITLSIQGQGSEAALGHVSGVPLDVVKRRAARRRQMLILQAISHSLITSVLEIAKAQGRNRIVSS
jgi:hypothetical protein